MVRIEYDPYAVEDLQTVQIEGERVFCKNQLRRYREYYHTHKKTKITRAQRQQMLEDQNFKCAACGGELPGRKGDGVDHDHKTGKIRGYIHRECNQTIGLLKDDPDRFRRIAEYLERHNR